jgi:uncharacterized protein YggE
MVFRNGALTAAMGNARADAETVAAAAGGTLGGARTVSTSNDGGAGPFPVYETRSDAGGGGTAVEPGTVRASATVTVVYDLE